MGESRKDGVREGRDHGHETRKRLKGGLFVHLSIMGSELAFSGTEYFGLSRIVGEYLG